MNLIHLIKTVNRGLNSTKSKVHPSLRAREIILNSIRSSDAEKIFGNFFGGSVYRYSKRMSPMIEVTTTPFGQYISGLQFNGGFYFDECHKTNKLDILNKMLSEINFEEHSDLNVIDLNAIENIKFA